MMSGIKVLIVSPWGLPQQWKECIYSLNTGLLPGININTKCESCSSSMSLFLSLQACKNISDVKMLIIGLDTLVPPDKEPIYDNAEKHLREFVEKIFDSTICENIDKDKKWLRNIEVRSVPGIGIYHKHTYKGNILYMFIEAYHGIIYMLETFKPHIILLDTTHGLNILTITTLYATVAASIIYGIKLTILNSEPIPPGTATEKCIKIDIRPPKIEEPPNLNILDISDLQWIIDYVRAINSIQYLNEKPLSRLIQAKTFPYRDNDVSARILNLLHRITCMIEALRTGLLGLVYPNSKYCLNDRNEEIPFNIDKIINDTKQLINEYNISFDKNIRWIVSKKNDSKINYMPNIKLGDPKYIVVLDALRKFVEKLEKRGLREYSNLNSFARKLANYIDERGFWDKKEIIRNEAANLMKIINEIIKNEKIYEISSEKLKKYWTKSKGIIEGSGGKGKGDLPNTRNFVAHAALNHNIIKKIEVKTDDNGINEVIIVYDYNRLLKTLQQIGKNSNLYKCLEKIK